MVHSKGQTTPTIRKKEIMTTSKKNPMKHNGSASSATVIGKHNRMHDAKAIDTCNT